MKIYELIPIYENVKSFYGKARVCFTGNIAILQSYTTNVATIDTKNNIAIVYGDYSNTTLRHIKEFLRQFGFKADTKKQILSDYCAQNERQVN